MSLRHFKRCIDWETVFFFLTKYFTWLTILGTKPPVESVLKGLHPSGTNTLGSALQMEVPREREMAPGKATCVSVCKPHAFQVATSARRVIRRNSKLLDLIMPSRVTSGLSITHYKNKSIMLLFIRCLGGCEATAAQRRCQELLSSRQFLISHPLLLTPNVRINYGWRYVNTKPLPVSVKCDRDISARPGLAVRSSLPGRQYRSNCWECGVGGPEEGRGSRGGRARGGAGRAGWAGQRLPRV